MKNHIIRLYVEIIKINIKGYLKLLDNNKIDIINAKAIKNNNQLSYFHDNIQHKILIDNNKITLTRENNEFKSIIEFKKNLINPSYYLLKEKQLEININIKTINLIYNKNEIIIVYKVLEADETYEYKIEMR